MGKTEGALLWIGNNKGFFTLPLRTAINAIYERIKDQIVDEEFHDRISILHGDVKSILLKDYNFEHAEEHYKITKQLAMPLTVLTIDQLFKFVYRHKNFEATLATLSYSKVVIDEIQMYSPDLLAYLVYGLKMITKLGGKFAILTATFPSFLGEIMKQEGIEFLESERPFMLEKNRHYIKVIDSLIDINSVLKMAMNKKTLIICNTIKQAKEVYFKLLDNYLDIEVKLLHSQFIKKDRIKKENQILCDGKSTINKTIIQH